MQALANRYANVLEAAGVRPEHRVLIALGDGPDYVAALFGILKIGAVVVMVNPDLKPDAIQYFFEYSRARGRARRGDRAEARSATRRPRRRTRPNCSWSAQRNGSARAGARPRSPGTTSRPIATIPAIWLFSGGTTGRPKAAVQPHRSFVNTAECYAQHVLGYTGGRRHPLGSEALLRLRDGLEPVLPVLGGRRGVLFASLHRGAIFEKVARHRPTVLINVPTMINQMVCHPEARKQDFSSLRVATSAGEGCRRSSTPAGTTRSASSCSMGSAPRRSGTSSSRTAPDASGGARSARSCPASRSRWATRRAGTFPTARWAASGCAAARARSATGSSWRRPAPLPRRVGRDGRSRRHDCGRLLHLRRPWRRAAQGRRQVALGRRSRGLPAAAPAGGGSGGRRRGRRERPREAAGRSSSRERRDGLAEELKAFVYDRLEHYKYPREVVFVDSLPRTHLGKVDRGRLRTGVAS